VAKAPGLRVQRAGLEASEPLKPAEEFVFLRHAPCVTLSEERLTKPPLLGSAREPLSLVGSGHLSRAWVLASVEGQVGPRIGSRPSIGSLRLERAPESRVEAACVLGLDLIPLPEGTRELTRWVRYSP
jgi:hypothetical protein